MRALIWIGISVSLACSEPGASSAPDAGAAAVDASAAGSDGAVALPDGGPADAAGRDAGVDRPDAASPDAGPPPFLPPGLASFRAPAYPLVTHDPYFSIWTGDDVPSLGWPIHWTGWHNALTSLARIDGTAVRLMGDDPVGTPLTPDSVHVTPTRTIYAFGWGGVELRLIFTSPVLAYDLELLGRPVTYVTWQARALDGGSHEVDVFFANSGELVVNTADQLITWSRPTVPGMQAVSMGSYSQPILERVGDMVRIDWGYVYQAAPQGPGVQQVVATNDNARNAFVSSGGLPASDDWLKPRPAFERWPVMATVLHLGTVGSAPVERHVLLAYDDLYSIELMGERLRPYWRRNGMGPEDLLVQAEADYARLMQECQAFDAELVADLDRLGSPEYTRLAVLSYRQAIAGHKLAAAADGTPLFFAKENGSNGCISTVDVIFPSSPLFLLLNPRSVQAMVKPVLDYSASGRWKFDFAPHDLGTYPKANGQVYGGGETSTDSQMPYEESGNMLILMATLLESAPDDPQLRALVESSWPLLERWANYLRTQGFDPFMQLSTDDFAGQLAHSANLSIKAILGIGAFAHLCERTGRMTDAATWRAVAEQFAAAWQQAADDGDHYRLAFDQPGTWSQKYNLVWQDLLGLGIFPPSVAAREMAWYRAKLLPYGLPLDNRETYSKVDSQVWTAMLTGDRATFAALTAPIAEFVRVTPQRVPMTDWYQTTDGSRQSFQARPVVGGVYLPLLADRAVWQKWVRRSLAR